MKNDSVKKMFDGITPVPYSKEFTEKVMANINYKPKVPFFRIFLLLALWGGLLFAVIDFPEFIACIDFKNVGKYPEAVILSFLSKGVDFGMYYMRIILIMAVPVFFSVVIIYDSISAMFDNMAQNMVDEYNRKNHSS